MGEQAREHSRFTTIFAGGTLLSRVLGLAREDLPVQAFCRVQAPRLVVRQRLLQEPPIGWVLGPHACLASSSAAVCLD